MDDDVDGVVADVGRGLRVLRDVRTGLAGNFSDENGSGLS